MYTKHTLCQLLASSFYPCFLPIFIKFLTLASLTGLTSAQTKNLSTPPCIWNNDPFQCKNVETNYMPELKSPCDYRMYVDFFKEVGANSHSMTPYNKVVGKDYIDHPHASKWRPKIMNPKYLCMRTDKDKNIDINQFDCLPDPLDIEKVDGFCGCGSRWSRIDFNYNKSYIGLNNISHSYEYFEFQGLDKFLTIQRKPGDQGGYECVAHRFGHCTLDDYKNRVNWTITKCQKGFKCKNISLWSPIKKSNIYNKNTGEWYGLCISEATPDTLMDPFSGSPSTGHLNSLIVILITSLTTAFVFHKLLFLRVKPNEIKIKCHSKLIS